MICHLFRLWWAKIWLNCRRVRWHIIKSHRRPFRAAARTDTKQYNMLWVYAFSVWSIFIQTVAHQAHIRPPDTCPCGRCCRRFPTRQPVPAWQLGGCVDVCTTKWPYGSVVDGHCDLLVHNVYNEQQEQWDKCICVVWWSLPSTYRRFYGCNVREKICSRWAYVKHCNKALTSRELNYMLAFKYN